MDAFATTAPDKGIRIAARRAAVAMGSGARKLAEAVTTPLLPTDFLELISPLRLGADLRGRVVAVQRETDGATTVTIRPGRGWRGHRPGQYTRIGIEVNGVRLWRAYSITSPLSSVGTITVTVRAITDGLVSNHVLRRLRPGTMLMLDQATGDFTLPDTLLERVLFLTAGSGITPIMGMLRNPPLPRDVVVVHSAPSPEQMLFRDELTRLADSGAITLIERFTERDGILTADRIGDVVPDWRERHTWACGPTALLDDADAHWGAHRASDQLHTERFRARIAAVGDGGTVTFAGSGIAADGDAATPILDAGEAAGVLMPSGCRMGICFNCVLPLTDGSVRDLRTGQLTSAQPEDPVLIQTCVSAAAGACTIAL